MDFLPNSTSTASTLQLVQELSVNSLQRPLTLVTALCTVLFGAFYIFTSNDPYNLNRIPAVHRPRFLDAYQSGCYWRLVLPRFYPYLSKGYSKYSKHDKPFKIWVGVFQAWAYILPLKHLPQIKNTGITELSLRHFIDSVLLPQFSSGNFDTFEVQIASKLMNGNLATIKPIVQIQTEEILEHVIGTQREWKRFNIRALSVQTMKFVSGRVVFGESLANSPDFLDAMERYTLSVIPSALFLRYFKIGPLRYLILYLIHLRHRSNLATATRYVTDLIDERKRRQRQHNWTEDQKPVDCIQWMMDADVPDELKTPEIIAHRLLHLSAAIIDAPITSMMNVLLDIITYARGDILEDLRAEMIECLAESNGAWTEASMAKMKKLDSFFQESFRMTSGLIPLTGLRRVTADSFRFDKDLVFPKGTVIAFPTQCIQRDADIYPDPDRFDYLRFYRMRENSPRIDKSTGKDIPRHDWLSFGHGRQACPGRFYSLRLLKTTLGEMMLRYDIRYAGGDRPRPDQLDLAPVLAPDYTVDIEFRART
ncbi:cytochrome P450 [Aspergillus heterothallicus]